MIALLLTLILNAHTAPLDQSKYEAVTGEVADEDKSFWDSFYKEKDDAYGKVAVGFLKEHLSVIPKGNALVPAMGEGRNAIYLAQHGFEVTGIDISDVAVDKARFHAKEHHVRIKSMVADLKQYKFKENEFDFVFLSLFYDPIILPGLKKTLKRNGYIMIYEELYSGDPQKATAPFWVKPKQLKDDFRDFKVIVYREFKDHGKTVAAILAQKP